MSHTTSRLSHSLQLSRRAFRLAVYAAARPSEFLTRVERYLRRNDPFESFLQYRNGLPSIVPLNAIADPAKAASLNVLLPGMAMSAMSGGPNTVINLVYRMAAQGVPVRFISTDIPADQDQAALFRHFSSLTGLPRLLNVQIVCGCDRTAPLRLGANDIFFASAWWNVQMIKHLLPQMRFKRFIYIIQDYEPGLYAWSTEYALALETYGLDYFPIVCSRFLAQYLAEHRIGAFADRGFARSACVFDPAVDAKHFYPDPLSRPAGDKKRLLFYARPTMAKRNLFELGLYALRFASESGVFAGEDWEFLFIGEPLPEVDLGQGNRIRSAGWKGYSDYGSLIRRSDIALSLMLSPHTSYPPLEIAASGGIAVTNTYANKTSEALHRLSPNILGVPATLDGIQSGLLEAVQRRRNPGIERIKRTIDAPTNWADALEDVVERAVEAFEEIPGRRPEALLATT